MPMYEELVHTAKVHLLQSIVSKLLVELVFGAYFVGLSDDQARQLSQMESLLSSFGELSPVSPVPFPPSQQGLADKARLTLDSRCGRTCEPVAFSNPQHPE